MKVLAVVAAPEETRTANPPLDGEAEMQAMLDAVTPIAGERTAQVQILEVAGPPQIAEAIRADAYQVLHLSAHGSAETVELEDEDGAPAAASAAGLLDALRHAGRPVPLIVLSSCAGAAGGTNGLAAGLIRRGADRVIAMQASVTDRYATDLAAALYTGLAADPTQPVAAALASARYHVEQHRQQQRHAAASAATAHAQQQTMLPE